LENKVRSFRFVLSTIHGAKGECRSFVSENRNERYTVSLSLSTATSRWIIKSPNMTADDDEDKYRGSDENRYDQETK
jgi:hypothetical protein